MWVELLASMIDDAHFSPGLDEATIAPAERVLRRQLPPDLLALLRESNGVSRFKEAWGGVWDSGVIWPLERIVEDNLAIRTDPALTAYCEPFEPLLFFADAGNGDRFGFDETAGDSIIAWDHEDDRRHLIASDLGLFLRGWWTGAIVL